MHWTIIVLSVKLFLREDEVGKFMMVDFKPELTTANSECKVTGICVKIQVC
jgi:hypothetical protein